jgi:hypothetical protein
MFRAVREWWLSGRGKHTARLFGFELTVVMIGVLAAQQASNWAEKRSALKQVEGLHRDLYHSFDIYRAIAAANRVAISCLDERVDLILQSANGDGDIDPHLLSPATLMGMGPDQISPDNEQLLRERFGDSTADKIGSVQFNLGTAERSSDEIERRWFEFQRLNPKHGPVTNADRSAVRETAVQIKGSLFALRKSSDTLLRLMALLDVPHRPEVTIRSVMTCDQMWQSGKGYVESR